MRTLIVTEFISVDGVIEAPGGEADFKHTGWTFDIEPDPTVYDFKLAETREAESLLAGGPTGASLRPGPSATATSPRR